MPVYDYNQNQRGSLEYWAPDRTYKQGHTVINPDGEFVSAAVGHISDNDYLSSKWNSAANIVHEGDIMSTVKEFGANGGGNIDDTAAIQQAVSAVKAVGGVLFWPAGGYKVTANIVDLHKVRHQGNGYILRDGVAFSPSPVSNRKNTLYVAPNGLATNDGLSPSTPMDVQTALNSLENYGPVLQGWWVIQHAAGTYPGGYAMPYMSGARRAVEMRGVNMGGPRITPTVIYDRAGANIAWGFITAKMPILISDIFFKNYDLYDHTVDGANAGGIRLDAYSDAILYNIHVDTADFGIYALTHTKYSLSGSYIKNCRGMGITELWFVVRAMAGDFASRNIIENCKYGIKAKELCTGHGDWNEYINNEYAVHMSRASTINSSNATFKRNFVMFVMSGSSTFVDLYLTLGTGVDKNTVFCRYVNGVANMRAGAENYLTAPYIGMTEKTLGYGKSAALTNTLSDTQLVPLGNFQIADFQGEGAWVRWEAYGTANMTSATTLIRLRIGGTTGVVITMPTGSYSWKFEGRMYVTADGDFQQIDSMLFRSNGNPIFSAAARTVAFSTIAYGFGLFCQLGGLTDTITVNQAVLFSSDL